MDCTAGKRRHEDISERLYLSDTNDKNMPLHSNTKAPSPMQRNEAEHSGQKNGTHDQHSVIAAPLRELLI